MAALKRLQMYINGEFIDGHSGEYFESFNPFTGKPWCLVPRGSSDDVERAVNAAKVAFNEGEWPKMGATARGHMLRKLGDLVAQNSERLAEIEVKDNGKLIAEMGMQLK